MAMKTEGDLALADLESGKFSFEMVDAIRDHMNKLEAELQRVGALHESAVNQLRQQEYTISRLEAELRKLNAQIYALLKANMLTEIAVREAKRGAEKFVEFLPVVREYAQQGSKKALAYLSTVDLKAQFGKLQAHPLTEKMLAWLANLDLRAEWTKLKTHPLTEKALTELQRMLFVARERLLLEAQARLPVARKQVAVAVEKASAYIADLHKKAA